MLSFEPDPMRWPSEEKATEVTPLESIKRLVHGMMTCHCIQHTNGVVLRARQNAVFIRRKYHASDIAGMALERFGDCFTSLYTPERNGIVM
jgi:hypothetical protein